MALRKRLMCTSPVLIKNPNLGLKNKGLGFMKDTVSQYIRIPCRHCAECVANMQMQLVQRVQMECLGQHCFFCTLTYNDDSLPVLYLPRFDGPGSIPIRFADVADVTNMLKRLRKRDAFGRPFRYLAVSELGSVRARPHFHILFFLPKEPGDDIGSCLNLERTMFRAVLSEWRRNYSSNWRKPEYRPLCTFVQKWTRKGLSSTFDLHWCNPALTASGVADVGFYVTKYMTKPSDHGVRLQRALHLNLEPDVYENVWSTVKPRAFASIGLGVRPVLDSRGSKIISLDPDIVAYLKSCVSKSIGLYNSPRFINPVDGSTYPLSRYYYRFGEIYSLQDSLSFYYLSSSEDLDNVDLSFSERDYQTMIQKEKVFKERTLPLIEQNYFDFDSLF